jgi:hypothetical protein
VGHPFTLEEMLKNVPTAQQISSFDMQRALREAKQKYSLKFLQLGKLEPCLQVSIILSNICL